MNFEIAARLSFGLFVAWQLLLTVAFGVMLLALGGWPWVVVLWWINSGVVMAVTYRRLWGLLDDVASAARIKFAEK